ncbi:putative uracil phosphoribosyltransferase [Trichuris suis]|nr:putative uracil phosphoribosyltransferase [Trichuris suis]
MSTHDKPDNDITPLCNNAVSSESLPLDDLISVRSGSSSGTRSRTFSGSKSEDHVVRWNGKVFYTAGRPPWYDCTGAKLRKPFIIGIAGGSASGKTTVANRIIESLDIQWVTLLSMDSFYNVLSNKQHEAAAQNRYNFDHPDAFDFDLLHRTLMRLKEGKRVVPAFDSFIAPTMRYADIIIPRGGSNLVAIDLIVKHIKTRLLEHDCKNRAALANGQLLNCNGTLPPSLHVLKQGPQIRGLHALIRNRNATRCEFIFYSNRLMRLLIEHSLSLLPFEECIVETPQGTRYRGKRRKEKRICGISILRAGETMETALREVVKDCIISKILIQTNPQTLEPELYYLTLPKDIHLYQILLMDATVATGAAAMMAIRILLDHDVPEENITLVALLMAEGGVQSVAYAFPKVRLVTTAVDDRLSPNYHILPGIGNFGDRYFGTEMAGISNENSIGVASEDEN